MALPHLGRVGPCLRRYHWQYAPGKGQMVTATTGVAFRSLSGGYVRRSVNFESPISPRDDIMAFFALASHQGFPVSQGPVDMNACFLVLIGSHPSKRRPYTVANVGAGQRYPSVCVDNMPQNVRLSARITKWSRMWDRREICKSCCRRVQTASAGCS